MSHWPIFSSILVTKLMLAISHQSSYIKLTNQRRSFQILIYCKPSIRREMLSNRSIYLTINIDQCDITLWRLILIKTITSIVKVSTYLITSIIARPIKLTVILYNYCTSLSAEWNMTRSVQHWRPKAVVNNAFQCSITHHIAQNEVL
jgi:hypothetical protein